MNRLYICTKLLRPLIATPLLAGLWLGGCAVESPHHGADAVCAEAAAHVAGCVSEETRTPDTCDRASAELALGTSCEAIAAGGGKGDGWWCLFNPFLPDCAGEPDDGDPPGADPDAPATHGVTGYVGFTWGIGTDPSGIGCAYVELRNAEGDTFATHTNPVGAFAFGALPAGEYELRVLDAEGNVALDRIGEPAIRFVDVNGDQGHQAIVLARLANGSSLDFEVGTTSEEAVSRCGNVAFDLTLLDTCGIAIAPYADSRYEWVLRLEGEAATDYGAANCQPIDGDHWAWDGCGGDADDVTRAYFGSVIPGTYRVTAFRVDLPERNNLDYEEELEWRRHEAFDLGDVEVVGDARFEASVEDPRADDC